MTLTPLARKDLPPFSKIWMTKTRICWGRPVQTRPRARSPTLMCRDDRDRPQPWPRASCWRIRTLLMMGFTICSSCHSSSKSMSSISPCFTLVPSSTIWSGCPSESPLPRWSVSWGCAALAEHNQDRKKKILLHQPQLQTRPPDHSNRNRHKARESSINWR